MKYYFIGIKGSGMSALAQIMHDLGDDVIGYDDNVKHDFTEDALTNIGIKIYYDQSYPLKDEIVVHSSAIRNDHPELERAKKLNLKCYLYNEMLGELTKKLYSYAICGCHGKTTTTCLLSHVLENIVGTNYLVGDGTGHANKNSNKFVLEACEFRRNFLQYIPEYIIMTNIEEDHMDYYKDIDDIKDAFQTFANKAKKQVIACGDDKNIRSLKIDKPVLYYGFNDNNDFIAKNVILSDKGSFFDVYYKDELIGSFKLPLYGKHMVLNALSVIAVCYLEKLDINKVNEEIMTFKGAKRRFKETVIGDIILIDDYAHHPTEVKVTIESARQKYPDKFIVALFLPHTLSRVKMFYKEFADALNLADKAYVMEVYNDRENPDDWKGVSSKIIIDELKNGEYIDIDSVDKLLQYKNTVFLFMSSKAIYVLQNKFEELLKIGIKI